MERALSKNPALRKGVILEQLPRNNFSHLANLMSIYNTTLKQLVAASPYQRQLAVIGHPSLALTTTAKTAVLFGHPPPPAVMGYISVAPRAPGDTQTAS